MPDITAKIRAKGLDSTGVTEQIANQLYTAKGSHMMAIVEWRVTEVHEKADGERRVDLILTQVEPATDPNLTEHLRELTRTLYYNRQVASSDQPTLETAEGTEPTVDAVLAAGQQHRPHPYVTSQLAIDDSENGPVCDVCGRTEDAGVHNTNSGVGDPFTIPDDHDQDEPDDVDEPDESDDRTVTPIRR